MTVLKREDLEDSPLADLHAIASELGLEGFRSKRKADLIDAILGSSGGATAAPADEAESDEVPAEERLEAPAAVAVTDAEPGDEADDEASTQDTSEDTSEGTSEGTSEDEDEEGEEDEEPAAEEQAAEEQAAGVLDILANGSGFVRVDPAGQSRDDVYVSSAQIRRCELRAGDQVSGPVRPPRRNERHPSLTRVSEVNGRDAEPPEQRPWFGDLTPVFPSARLDGPEALAGVPFGRGSRVAIGGPPGAGATTLLHEIASALAGGGIDVQVVLAGVRPEELAQWRTQEGVTVVGGSFERSAEPQAQAAELAAERAKRQVERGGHAALIVDSLAALPSAAARRIFGVARATDQGGTLTVVGATGDLTEALRWATTRIVLEPGGRVDAARSGTLRADALS